MFKREKIASKKVLANFFSVGQIKVGNVWSEIRTTIMTSAFVRFYRYNVNFLNWFFGVENQTIDADRRSSGCLESWSSDMNLDTMKKLIFQKIFFAYKTSHWSKFQSLC